jgi:dipeptidyl aminopeptidase/acylaminoacyl peptidase
MTRPERELRSRRVLAAGTAAVLLASAAPVPAATPPLHRESGDLVFDNIPPPDAALTARLSRYLESRGASVLDWLPDGRVLIAIRFGDTEQLHQVSAAMGAREQLTFYSDAVTVARAAPAGGGLVFLKDQDGDGNAQLYYRAADGAMRELTSGKFTHGSPVWAHDSRRVAFDGNDRDGVSFDVYIADVGTHTAPQLLVGGGKTDAKPDTWHPLDWSADDAKLLVERYVSVSESYLYVADATSGNLTPVDPKGRTAGIRAAKFSPDGHGVYELTDEAGEFMQVLYRDLVTHETRHLTPDDAGWDVEAFDVSADGRYLAYVQNQDGRSHLVLEDLTNRIETSPAGVPEGVISELRFDHSGDHVAFSVETAQSPRDVYVYDLRHDKLERWTRSEAGPIGERELVQPELVHFPTWDRVAGHPRMLSAYLYRPRNAPGSCPTVVLIHDGPEAQARPGWEPFVQLLVNELGYAVIEPNVRGSSGYGKSFLALDSGELREDAVRDIGSLLVWLGVQSGFDREHVAIMGTSYGGYMALAALVSYGERLSGGIDAFLDRISPFTNADRIKRPLLVVAGLNDPRVPASESDQLVWQVRSGGGEVWYLVAKHEGHGFTKKTDRDAYFETAAMFLQKLAR